MYKCFRKSLEYFIKNADNTILHVLQKKRLNSKRIRVSSLESRASTPLKHFINYENTAKKYLNSLREAEILQESRKGTYFLFKTTESGLLKFTELKEQLNNNYYIITIQ